MQRGDEVILDRFYGPGWTAGMEPYVGTKTKITDYLMGNYLVDNNSFFWPEDALIPVLDLDIQPPARVPKYKDICPCGIHPSRCTYHKNI